MCGGGLNTHSFNSNHQSFKRIYDKVENIYRKWMYKGLVREEEEEEMTKSRGNILPKNT